MVRFNENSKLQHWAGMALLGLSICGVSGTQGRCVAAEPAPLRAPKPLNGLNEKPLADNTAQDVVRERYPNRNTKIERHVAQDADGNFVNHGSWTMWDEQGREMGTGEYIHGKRTGIWTRTFLPGELEILAGPLGKQFVGPYTSTATFENDMLQGQWTIVDADGRTALVWNFRDDRRHGRCVWNFPNGEPWREVEYVEGDPHGVFTEWSPEGEVIASERYINGHRELVQNEFYTPGVKKTEAQFLMARELTEVTIDWWNGIYRIKVVGSEGKDLRHGPWATWYPNGQIAAEGQYVQDSAEGKFSFWHANGQKSIEGNYVGGQQVGRWIWWHENGLKSIVGNFEAGEQVGSWNWWQADGKLVESAMYSEPVRAIANKVVPEQQIASTPKRNEPTLAPPKGVRPATGVQPSEGGAEEPTGGVPSVASRPSRLDESPKSNAKEPFSSRTGKPGATKLR